MILTSNVCSNAHLSIIEMLQNIPLEIYVLQPNPAILYAYSNILKRINYIRDMVSDQLFQRKLICIVIRNNRVW